MFDIGVQDPSGCQFPSLYKSVDVIQFENPTIILSPEEDQQFTVGIVKQKYKSIFAQMAQRYAPFSSQQPALYALIQSHRDFLQTGWIEDSFCVNGCIQSTLQTDFSVQAIAYEALLEAATESGLNFVSFDPQGCWYTDTILPKDSFPNTSQSVRNKPAEAIIQRWFAK